VLWKKVRRQEILKEEAVLAARLLQGSSIEVLPTRSLLEPATRLAVELDHPAYDCLYLALAIEKDCPFVTADERFRDKLRRTRRRTLRGKAISLSTAAE
jgi:predicted nucleic acid-binding protein